MAKILERLALAIPSPRAWVREACRQAFAAEVQIGGGEAEACAVQGAAFCSVESAAPMLPGGFHFIPVPERVLERLASLRS